VRYPGIRGSFGCKAAGGLMNAITARDIHIDVRAVNPGSHFVNIHASDMSWHARDYTA
jgi:hypothetical protein